MSKYLHNALVEDVPSTTDEFRVPSMSYVSCQAKKSVCNDYEQFMRAKADLKPSKYNEDEIMRVNDSWQSRMYHRGYFKLYCCEISDRGFLVWTERRRNEVNAKKTEVWYFTVQTEQARSINCLLYGWIEYLSICFSRELTSAIISFTG